MGKSEEVEEVFEDGKFVGFKLTRKGVGRILQGEILESYHGHRVGMVEE